MIVILCLDDNNGMMFNHRRQSRDQAVVLDIALMSKGSRLSMKEYSFKMFADLELENVFISSEVMQQAEESDYCFVEDMGVLAYLEKIEQLIIYKWNRKYPADFYLDITLEKGWELSEIKEFVGTSHEKITKEIYIKCENYIGYLS
ncbi:MAG: hypothetical protein K0S61_4188 [Anaerocolumna sp.]|jgi:hypothetical protein|nr:hypothetical protein [Anaerocolumna sp.]